MHLRRPEWVISILLRVCHTLSLLVLQLCRLLSPDSVDDSRAARARDRVLAALEHVRLLLPGCHFLGASQVDFQIALLHVTFLFYKDELREGLLLET